MAQEKEKDWFSKFVSALNTIGCSLVMLLMGIIVIDVSGRLFLNHPIRGTPEIVQSTIVALAFLQVSFVQMENRHLRATVLYDRMSFKAQKTVDLITYVIGIFVFALLIYSGWNNLIRGINVGEFEGDGSFRLPTVYVRSAIVFCSAVNILVMLRQFIRRLREKEGAV